MSTELQTLRGQVQSIRVFREGWGTLEVLDGSATSSSTVVGHPLGVTIGDTVECSGHWTTHPKWGRQFKAREIRSVIPTDASGAIEWMCSRLPAIGRKLATAIAEQWGIPGAWEMLEHRPHELEQLHGITPERARAIAVEYKKLLPERDRIVAFKQWGLTDRQIARVLEAWGDRALERMRANPYELAEVVDGFGFVRADAVAIKMGVSRTSPDRIRAGLLHLLSEAAQSGHVYVVRGKLVAMAAQLLGVDGDLVATTAPRVMGGGIVVVRGTRVYPARLERAEANVAKRLRALAGRRAA